MPYLADDLSRTHALAPDGHWYCKKPETGSFFMRLWEAWEVLKGNAIAVIFKI